MTQIHWASAVNGQFGDAGLWSGGAVPGASDDALLDAAGPARFIVASSTDETVASVQLAANATLRINAGTFDALGGTGAGANWGTIAVSDGAVLSVGGALSNAGVIALNSFGDETNLILAADTTLNGGGSLTLTNYATNRIEAAVGTAVILTNVDNTVTGSGDFDASGGLTLHNETFGIIDASGAMTIGSSSGTGSLVNDGLIEATGAGSLTIQNETLTGSGGTLFAGYRSGLTLTNCTVSSQALTMAPEGQIRFTGASSVTLSGTFHNPGNLGFAGGAILTLGGGLTLDGGGTVELAGVTIGAPKGVLTNVDNRISLSNNVGGTGFGLINKAGGVIGTAVVSVTINTGAKGVQNAGLIETNNGTLSIAGAVRNSGTLAVAGGTMTIGGVVTGRGSATITGGTFDFAAASNQDVSLSTYNGVSVGTLELEQSQAYTGVVSGLYVSNLVRLDLRDIGFVGSGEASYVGTTSGGVLTVSDGTHTAAIQLSGNYLNKSFLAVSDGADGVFIYVTKAKGSQATPRFLVEAMAGMGGAGGATVNFGSAEVRRDTMLAAPRAMTV